MQLVAIVKMQKTTIVSPNSLIAGAQNYNPQRLRILGRSKALSVPSRLYHKFKIASDRSTACLLPLLDHHHHCPQINCDHSAISVSDILLSSRLTRLVSRAFVLLRLFRSGVQISFNEWISKGNEASLLRQAMVWTNFTGEAYDTTALSVHVGV